MKLVFLKLDAFQNVEVNFSFFLNNYLKILNIFFLDKNGCSCDRGWSALNCENQINCKNNSTCFSNGKCILRDKQYICFCPYGYGGSKCLEKLPTSSNYLILFNKLSSMEQVQNLITSTKTTSSIITIKSRSTTKKTSKTIISIKESKLIKFNNKKTKLSLIYLEIMVKLTKKKLLLKINCLSFILDRCLCCIISFNTCFCL